MKSPARAFPLGLALAGLLATICHAGSPGDEQNPVPLQVEAGEIVFLERHPGHRVLRSINTLFLEASSLQSGWVVIRQCYQALDPVPSTGIEFRYREMRGLAVVSASGIAEVRVDHDAVHLVDVQPGAELCLALEARILYEETGGVFLLRNGPFHRRFLDGYFPMRVVLEVRYPARVLEFLALTPQPRPGLQLETGPGVLRVDALFAGALELETRFRRR